MKRTLLSLLLAGGLMPTQAALLSYQAILDGPSESPANASPGTGFATAVYDTVAHTLNLNVSFSGLTGTTTASHIHGATTTAFSGTAGVATTTPTFAGFPLGVTAGTYNVLLDLTQASSYNPSYVTANGGTTGSAEIALTGAIAAGKAYLNIHSTTFGGGEIRGFWTVVPEPSSLSLYGCGVLVFAIRARMNRRKGRA